MFDPKGQKMDVFNTGVGVTPLEADAAIYGLIDVPDSGRIVAKPTDINSIWADRKQPRRAIPSNIALHWHGDPDAVPELLNTWHLVAEKAADTTFDLAKLLRGEGEGLDSDKFPSVTQDYIELVRLAADIYQHKLVNAITIVESDGRLLIESGERRWLAFHLLAIHIGDEWSKIPATKADGKDSVFRQAGENMKRSPLNAIGKARQLALLIMAVRESVKASDGPAYRDYVDIVTNGASDRRYYAQVADGNMHRIPKGSGEKIQGAMSLGKDQINQYRDLLRLTDDEQINDILWTRADVESWPEYTMRAIRRITPVILRGVLDRAEWSLDDLKALVEAPPAQPQRRPVTSEWMNKRVVTKGGVFGKVIAVLDDEITVLHENGMPRKNYHMDELTMAAERLGEPPRQMIPDRPAPQMVNSGYRIGEIVRTPGKGNGEVVNVSGRLIGIRTATGTFMFDYSYLSKVDIQEADDEAGDAPKSKMPNYSEGWTDGEGGINPRYAQQIEEEEASDKADSKILTVEQPIIPGQSTERFFLLTLRTMAGRLEDKVTLDILNDILEMKPSQARELQAEDKLIPATSEASVHVFEVVGQWLANYLGGALSQIEEAGKSQ